jgi:uncharacterized Fe-S center protein
MSSPVYYGSPRQAKLDANETLPAKLEMIIDRLHIRDRVKDEVVAIKMHLGNNLSYSTVHPVFVRKVVQAVKDGGGKPFVVDLVWDWEGAQERGYSPEVLGCPVVSSAGLDEKYHYMHEYEYKNIKQWGVAGLIEDSTFLIDFAHIKGHPSCSYGGAIKNLALGCMIGETRSAIHDTNHFDKYWFAELCPDEATRNAIIASCPHGAIVQDRHNASELHVHFEPCNQCGRCLKVAPEGSLKIVPVNFQSFQEACAISAKITLDTFAPGKTTFLSLATHMTPVCDCFGFTSLPIMPDAGIFGSDDIVAIEQAVLDMTGKTRLLVENVPTSMEPQNLPVHPLSQLHGPMKNPYHVVRYAEKLGMGSSAYELVDVCPVVENSFGSSFYVKAN